MIPIRDRIPTQRVPVVTLVLIAVNVLVYLYQLLLSATAGQAELSEFIYSFGVVPARVTGDPGPATWLTFVTSMFLHGSPIHIGSNMLYLWVFGNNIEDITGHFWFIVFYFLAGFAATFAQVLASLGSNVPGIGASGAIAGVLAAYLLFFPRSRVDTLIFFGYFVSVRALPAIIVLGLWFVLQLFNGILSFGAAQVGGVAYFAHIGGFVAGLVLAIPWIGRARRVGAGHRYS